MEERSLRIYNSEKTFFSKLTNTTSKLLIPTKIGLNGMIISIKRNNVLKAYELLNATEAQDKKEVLTKKLDEEGKESKLVLYAISKVAGSTTGIEKVHVDDIIKLCKNFISNNFNSYNFI